MAERPRITDQFDPEQIYQIIEEYLSVVGRRQYIGARYVPIFGRVGEDSIEWDNTAPYEPLTIVLYQGNSYTSRQYVPTGIEIDNQAFWANTGNYNAQIEAYRREVANAIERVSFIEDSLPIESFTSENTVKDYIDNSIDELEESTESAYDRLRTNTLFGAKEQIYVGRLSVYDDVANKYGQGMCLMNDTTMLCARSNADKTTCIIQKVNLSTLVIAETYTNNALGHCNDICYDKERNVIYAVSGELPYMYVLDASNMQTIDTKMLTHEVDTVFMNGDNLYVGSINGRSVTVYSVDGDYQLNEFASITKTKIDQSVIQVLRMDDDYIYALNGAYDTQSIDVYKHDGTFVNSIQFGNNIFYFHVQEYQAFDIDESGDIYLFGNGSYLCNRGCANVITVLNISGSKSNRFEYDVQISRNARVNGTKNANYTIAPTGETQTQFPSLDEGIAFASTFGCGVYVESDCFIVGNGTGYLQSIGDVYINGNNHKITVGLADYGSTYECEGGNITFDNATIDNIGQGSSFRLYNGNARFVGCKIDFTNYTNVAPLRFNYSNVLFNSTCDVVGTSHNILTNDCFVIAPTVIPTQYQTYRNTI